MIRLLKTKLTPWAFLWGVLAIPLNSLNSDWKVSSYAKIKPNQISFSEDKLNIEVNQSSSPLFYKLANPVQVEGFSVEGSLTGLPEINRLKEGQKENDDFSFRLGFIETNQEPPNWTERLFMADWVTELLKQFPNQGLKKVRFFTFSQIKNPGSFRVHPDNDLIEETVCLKKEQPGKFNLDYTLPKTIPAAAIWVQPDGDDSKSHFNLSINKLEIKTAETLP